MFRIRRIHDDVLAVNRQALAQVKEILRAQFSALDEAEIESLGEKLRNPFKQRFRSILYAAENQSGRVLGFALCMFDPEIPFMYLDFIASAPMTTSRGMGGALYLFLREEARSFGVKGLFFECLPDDPAQCPDRETLRQNQARLRFYERFDARPIAGTLYHLPVREGDTGMPYLVYDGLGAPRPLRRGTARKVVRAVLERKYADFCPPEYVAKVVSSFKDDPVRLRPPRYVTTPATPRHVGPMPSHTIALVVNQGHDIHHVHDRGYVEAPVRIHRILSELERSGLFERVKKGEHRLKEIKEIHDRSFVDYLRRVCAVLSGKRSVYPYVFPIRNAARPPKELPVRAGYFCIDTFTPLNRNAFLAARGAADCALTAADFILDGRRLVYALVRPPGHHAERSVFGGFCYFNNTALAANRLSRHGRVSILDIDYHHGNGQQDIFYGRNDVQTISIHGHPNIAYPYFSGFADEKGEGPGEGFNINYPLPETADGERYRKTLDTALKRIQAFNPLFLVVALGLDTARGDPTGTWTLTGRDFEENGLHIGRLGLPTCVIQEGGYRTRTLGANARRFFIGLHKGSLL